MIESPLLDELKEEWMAEGGAKAAAEVLFTILEERFGSVPDDLAERVRSLSSSGEPAVLTRAAVHCVDLDDFRLRLAETASNAS